MMTLIILSQAELTALRVLVVTTIADYLDEPDRSRWNIYEYCALRRFYKKVFTRYYLTQSEMRVKLSLDEYIAIIASYGDLHVRDNPQLDSTIASICRQTSEIINFIPNGFHYAERIPEKAKKAVLQ